MDQRKATLREVEQAKYPELGEYTKDQIWRDAGPGGLYLLSLLAAELELEPGALVLDLGCGAAESSIWLARHYGASVVAADLWTDPV